MSGTPVYAANSEYIQIQELGIGEYVYANTSVAQNIKDDNSLRLINFPEWKDPYTSDEQRYIDQLNLVEEQWFIVSFNLKYENGKAKLIRPKQWITDNNIKLNEPVFLSLPEQNIFSTANVTGIKPFTFETGLIDESPDI